MVGWLKLQYGGDLLNGGRIIKINPDDRALAHA